MQNLYLCFEEKMTKKWKFISRPVSMKQWKIYTHACMEKSGKKGKKSRNLYIYKTMKKD